MIKIALCDDENEQLAQMESLLKEYRAQHLDAGIAVNRFSSAISLLEHLRMKGAFDLYLLDVIMPGIDGIELGMNIRELDQGGYIVYLTTSPDFAVDSYRTGASDYLLKPVEKDRLFQTLDRIVERLTKEEHSFLTIKTRDGFQRIPLHSIMYGELVNRRVRYNLTDGSSVNGMSLRGSFQDAVKPLLAHDGFVLCAASFFVNLSYVEVIGSSELHLTGGSVVPVSRSLRAEVTNRWMDYCFEGGRWHA